MASCTNAAFLPAHLRTVVRGCGPGEADEAEQIVDRSLRRMSRGASNVCGAVVLRKRRLGGEQLEEEDAEGPDVRRRTVGLALSHLRRPILVGAAAGGATPAGPQETREPKVSEDRAPVRIEQNVLRPVRKRTAC